MHKFILTYVRSSVRFNFLFFSPISAYGKVYPNRAYMLCLTGK